MPLVFKVGDTVYHYVRGQGTIRATDDPDTNLPYRVCYTSGEHGWENEKTLSFSPWPAPNHERPLQDGLYMVTYSKNPGGTYLVIRKHDMWFWADGAISLDWSGHSCSVQNGVSVVKFLHDLPK